MFKVVKKAVKAMRGFCTEEKARFEMDYMQVRPDTATIVATNGRILAFLQGQKMDGEVNNEGEKQCYISPNGEFSGTKGEEVILDCRERARIVPIDRQGIPQFPAIEVRNQKTEEEVEFPPADTFYNGIEDTARVAVYFKPEYLINICELAIAAGAEGIVLELVPEYKTVRWEGVTSWLNPIKNGRCYGMIMPLRTDDMQMPEKVTSFFDLVL